MKTPASDAIYRTITDNKRVIDNHTHKLDKICQELRGLQLYNSTGWEATRPNRRNTTLEDSLNINRSKEYEPKTLLSSGVGIQASPSAKKVGSPRYNNRLVEFDELFVFESLFDIN